MVLLAMPSRKTPDGEFKDIAHPINMGTRRDIQESVYSLRKAIEEEQFQADESKSYDLELVRITRKKMISKNQEGSFPFFIEN